ncbi:MAG TPA: exodeoxyribonuclease III [Clostridia bacterium]|nr:MAG: Exodeoxyribonuclease [Firmicutes bacterium ADurb.Bin248]HOG00581.1 exodeoxyribonuclease III [Clostridia bacterium]HOS19061.1 exodeoxyribonuclease III [Clostridia bacterium]HPK14756.1 exodeoxyribonuclease III [Clostridia bacterium]
MPKLVSWNVNGFRACLTKGFAEFFAFIDADVLALQETKLQPGQVDFSPEGYVSYWHSAEKKGYSGTAVFAKREPLSVAFDLPEHGKLGFPKEGRVITLEYEDYYFVNCYTPNSQRELLRLEHRMDWEEAFRAYLVELDKLKPVILCGDLNVAHREIDIRHPAANRRSAGFTDEERGKFTELLAAGFTDSFRHLYPERKSAYTWWSYMGNARANNSGWRIDYFVVSDRLRPRVRDSVILPEVMGSDHCPVMLELEEA